MTYIGYREHCTQRINNSLYVYLIDFIVEFVDQFKGNKYTWEKSQSQCGGTHAQNNEVAFNGHIKIQKAKARRHG